MKEIKQRIVNGNIGDCFAACMATLLELPIEVLPNDHSPAWFAVWDSFLSQFGLDLSYKGSKEAIWQSYPWIASVKSRNFKNGNHAIIMEGGKVLFDPSTHKIYRKDRFLSGKDIVLGGYIIAVSDFSKLHLLKEYRDKMFEAVIKE